VDRPAGPGDSRGCASEFGASGVVTPHPSPLPAHGERERPLPAQGRGLGVRSNGEPGRCPLVRAKT
jgi:hypothetical protein